MYYWDRAFVDDRLRLSRSQSYRLIPATPSGRIRSDAVLLLLCRSRRGSTAPVETIPADLLTAKETVERFAESGLTLGDLRRWTSRRLKPIPHFRINQAAKRFSAAEVERWLAAHSSGRRNGGRG